eukprot:2382536-Pyramimonas_sp.AAC.1
MLLVAGHGERHINRPLGKLEPECLEPNGPAWGVVRPSWSLLGAFEAIWGPLVAPPGPSWSVGGPRRRKPYTPPTM